MKCSNHIQTDAVATCVFCGHGLCSSCVTHSSSGRAVCSPRCADRSASIEAALETIRQKTVTGNRLAAHFLLAAGFVFAGLGIYEMTKAVSTGRVWAMTFAMPGLAVIFIVAGIALLRMLKSKP
jgi:hypothetical protein